MTRSGALTRRSIRGFSGCMRAPRLALGLLIFGTGCSLSPPEAEAPVIRARFDPKAGVIPRPTDVLRDRDAKRLVIPATPEDLANKTPAEAAVIQELNTRDGWPSRTTVELTFSGAVRASSVDGDSVQLF